MQKPMQGGAVAIFMVAALAACAPDASKTGAGKAPPAPVAAVPAAPAAFIASEDVYPFAIGGLQAAALRDGTLEVDNDNKVFAINKKKADVAGVLNAAGLLTDKIQLSLQPLIVRGANRVLLFDAGASDLFGPTLGKLPASLAAAKVNPGSVTDIFISHAHGDHVGGLVAKPAALAFANASIHISRNEWTAMQADKSMAPLTSVIAPKVSPFDPEAEIVPGVVKAVDIQGHTPGHSGYLITSDGQSLLYQGDVMHHSVLSVQQPDWTIQFDGDARTAQASRKVRLAEWAASGQRVFAPHFPFPGLGKFEKKGDGYVWTAESRQVP